MIVFDLKCGDGHRFEAWFKDSATFEAQAAGGTVPCPYCGGTDVTKALMAPNINKSGATHAEPMVHAGEPAPSTHSGHGDGCVEALARRAHEALKELREHVEATHENVGKRFPEEARKIHYGESDRRGIYGEATLEDARSLSEEGIDVLPLGPARTDA